MVSFTSPPAISLPAGVVNDWRQIKLLQLAYERELGMTPVSRAAVSRDHGKSEFDLVAAMARSSPKMLRKLASPSKPPIPASDSAALENCQRNILAHNSSCRLV